MEKEKATGAAALGGGFAYRFPPSLDKYQSAPEKRKATPSGKGIAQFVNSRLDRENVIEKRCDLQAAWLVNRRLVSAHSARLVSELAFGIGGEL